ncbi:MAG: NUDIX domain-containing protein [Thermoplasmata archaeon]|nr:NUDIX domain-containing protein [Thermoplasmata archaeon]
MTPPPSAPGRSIAELLEPHPVVRPPVHSAGAAVTVVLREGSRDVEVLLIERATDDSDPASGQVALPGGHVAERDGNLTLTALRELEEEVGLSQDDLEGDLHYVSTEFARRFGLKVAVFAARLGARGNRPVVRSPREVAHVFWLPQATLEGPTRVERETSLGRLPVSATVHEGHVLWGFTRRVLCQFFDYPLGDDPFGPVFAPTRPPR